MHGDQVLVEVGTIRPDGRAEGRIIRPVNRAHTTVVGTFHYGSRYNYVTPIDEKIRQEIVIPPGMEYPEDKLDASETHDRSAAVPGGSRASAARRGRRSRQPAGRRRTKGGAKKSVDRVLGDEAARRANLGRSRRRRGRCRDHRLAFAHAESARQGRRDSRLRRRFRRRRRDHDPQAPPAAPLPGGGARTKRRRSRT